jgi:hypothetical protein
LWILGVNALGFLWLSKLPDLRFGTVFKRFPENHGIGGIPDGHFALDLQYLRGQGKTKEVIVLQPNVDPYTEKYDTPNLEIAKDCSSKPMPSSRPTPSLSLRQKPYLPRTRHLTNFTFHRGAI